MIQNEENLSSSPHNIYIYKDVIGNYTLTLSVLCARICLQAVHRGPSTEYSSF